MKIRMEIDELTLKNLVVDYVRQKLGDIPFIREDIQIEVKSTQNYRAEWEVAAFRAVVEKTA
jgi:hypothetical protein